MRRSSTLRTRVRVGRASRRRIRAGGQLALGRPSATLEAWREIRAQVLARAQWRCQACRARTRLEVHHVVKRAQGGSDFELDRLVALCRSCHAQTDAPYARGRLIVTPNGDGRFTFLVVRAPDKWAMRTRTDSPAAPAIWDHPAIRLDHERAKEDCLFGSPPAPPAGQRDHGPGARHTGAAGGDRTRLAARVRPEERRA